MAMIDNRKVKDSHQEGILRVKQRAGDMHKGQCALMGENHRHKHPHDKMNNAQKQPKMKY